MYSQSRQTQPTPAAGAFSTTETAEMKTYVAVASIGLISALALVAGCRKEADTQANNPNNFQGGYGQQPQPGYQQQPAGQPGYQPQPAGQPGYQPQPAGQPAPAATGQPAPAGTGTGFFGLPIPAIPGFGAPAATGTAAGGTAPAGGAAASNPSVAMLAPSLVPLQQKYAPGAQKEGEAIGGMLNEGQSSEQQVTLQAGKCYTGIGAGAPTISELVVELVTPPPMPPQVMSASTPGPMQVVMAAQPNCFRNPFPMGGPAVFRVTARKGSGPAIAQLYAK
jgi:hypothetical protein